MIKRYVLSLIAFLCLVVSSFGQLNSGDIAIIGIDTPGEDFSFVTFVPLASGTTIYFTDEEADNDYTIGTGEGTVLYTAPIGGVIAGQVISYQGNTSDFTTTSDDALALSNSGDGILAYQGLSVGNVTTFLHAIGEDTGDIGTFPDGFTNYILIGTDDGEYNGDRTGGTPASYLADINNVINWTTTDSGVTPFDLTNFTFGPTITANPTNITGLDYVFENGPSASQSFDVSGVLLTAGATITAPTNFEVSLDNSTFFPSVTIPLASVNNTNTTVYTRLKSGLAISTYSGSISISSTGATTQNIAVSGEVLPPPPSTVTVTQASGGTISPGTTDVPNGNDQAFTATPNSCHNFSYWMVDGSNAGNANPYTFTNVTSPHTITAVYLTKTHNIVASAAANGSISPNGTSNVTCGTDQTFTITPDSGYAVGDVLVDGVSVGAVTSYTFNSVDSGHTISASFIEYTGPCVDEEFTDNNAPTGWTFSGGFGTYTSNNNYGNNSPSLKFDGTNDRIVTPTFSNAIELSFWIKGQSTNSTSSLLIEGYNGSTWVTIDNITNSIPTTGTTFTYNLASTPALPTGIEQFRFTYTKSSGNLAFDDVLVTCDTSCTPTHSISGISPASGPEDTLVTISGTGFTAGMTANFNGTTAAMTYVDANTLTTVVPAGASTGDFELLDTMDCSTAIPFTVISNLNSTCDNSIPYTSELSIYEIYDESPENGGMITIFNGTPSAIDMSNYKISRTTDYNDLIAEPYKHDWHLPSGTLASGDTYRLKISSSICDDSYYTTPYSTISNTGFNENDGVQLRRLDNTVIDELFTPNYKGYYLKRNLNTLAPNTTYNAASWNETTLTNYECRVVGVPPVLEGTQPTVTMQPNTPAVNCDATASITIAGAEGVSGGNSLAYQWYFSAPGDAGWTPVSDGAVYSGATATTLNMNNTTGLNNYQYYCQVRENTATCYTASNAVKITASQTVWNGTTWSNGIPDINTAALIDGDYNTATQGSFSACQLIVNAGHLLTVGAANYVEVENNVTVYGDGSNTDGIVIEDKGSFVQNGDSDDAGTFIWETNGYSKVNKNTALMNNWFEYTYWSSPVTGETVGNGLFEAHPTRRYWYENRNYLDATLEVNNNNAANPGQDDIDDNADDWQYTNNSDVMQAGQAFATMHNPGGFTGPATSYQYSFEGPFNTGDYSIPVYRNDSEFNDNNWNLIGNPYPSAIDADAFLAANIAIDNGVTEIPAGATDGAIFFWSQNTQPSGTTNGNEVLNFAQSDYAVINGSGQTAGGDGIMPTRYIPSGQSFFISMSDAATPTSASGDIKAAAVKFTNSMRSTGNNDKFFRASTTETPNKLWLNLTSDNGVFNQVLIAYVPGATNAYDGMYYDAPKNLSSDTFSELYSFPENSNLKLAIQGKATNSLTMEEIIPLGFITSINDATIYTLAIAQLEGEFLNNNTIYLKDNLLGNHHNLSTSDYSFTSETGEFNDRFEIVFNVNVLAIDEHEFSENFAIIELQNGHVKFATNNASNIENIKIYDVLGRLVYNLKGDSHTEIYDLSKLSQAAYIAKITLDSGQVINKKAVKTK